MVAEATTRRSRITPEREAELYGAVLELLREVGYDALTMDAVATRTRSSKATLYRQWGGKAELVVKALRSQKPHFDVVDTGSLRGDLHAMAVREDDCHMEQNSALMRGLMVAVHANPDLLAAFKEWIVAPEVSGLDRMLRRAVDRGEIRADNPALGYALHMLVGAFATRTLIDEEPPTQEYLVSYIDAVVLPALSA
ncbi:TetR/AcrR family transcriptional regulator [Streptomyces sp. NBC_00006]|uniref:TetR/AcrR family transcriptional regulator n=1 Tax=unclassified Streptomyces TaxID=2593676 RepID=UPI00224C7FF3|nr:MULTISPECIES: TetR/AcrR family transcriptional regulator [unclassified Streptomyces]MCX4827561.1 TetR/AcrR family transcriptional regulator [Streptomyces sp. NBC_01016]MCX5533029.1 TetR/AcrR family transcriptional regulator [Streptomyces sp. NBC_00006]